MSLVALAWVALPATERYMTVDELRPGMVGTGKTVFEGATVESFSVRILGVLRNAAGPQRDLILARLEGGPLAAAGVIAGMSGSPVYIDGRLVGAVAYSLGTFSKEPIAGITPIAEMHEAFSASSARPAIGAAARPGIPVTPAGLTSSLRALLPSWRPFATRIGDVTLLDGAATAGPVDTHLGMLLRPIATPLVMAGFEEPVRALIADAFRDTGVIPVAGGAGRQMSSGAPKAGPGRRLEPGDAVGVELVGGDFSIGATGTVTEVDGDRVYAFGHPFFNLGPTEFPMTRAHVYAVLPSLYTSMKIARNGESVGTFTQDRSTAVAGTLGKGPTLVPVRVVLDTGRGPKRDFRLGLVSDQVFTPLLTYAALLNIITSFERQAGVVTFAVQGKAVVKNRGEVDFSDVFSGDTASVSATSYLATPIAQLVTNDFERVVIEKVDIALTATELQRSETLERVWLDTPRPRAGQTLAVRILSRTYRGEDVTRTVSVTLPPNAKGRLSLLVADGTRLAQMDQRETGQAKQLESLPQMIRFFNRLPKNSSIYVRLLAPEAGAIVGGEQMAALPPSALAVYEADRSGGSFVPLRTATLGQWEIGTDSAITGSRTLTIDLEPER
jgi:SpoIVB peptidase S55